MTLMRSARIQRFGLPVVGLSLGFGVAFGLQLRSPAQAGALAHVSAPAASARPTVPHRRQADRFLPTRVGRALAAHRGAVLAFFVPRAQLDATALAEARVAAAESGAAFLPVDATRPASDRLLARYGVTSTPAVVVLEAGDRVAFRTTTFLDVASVAQAVADAQQR
jgi:thiol:disulfide interchange protein